MARYTPPPIRRGIEIIKLRKQQLVGRRSQSKSDTGNPPPKSDTGNPQPKSDTGNPQPKSDTGNPQPKSDTGNPQPRNDTGNPPPRSDTGNPPPERPSSPLRSQRYREEQRSREQRHRESSRRLSQDDPQERTVAKEIDPDTYVYQKQIAEIRKSTTEDLNKEGARITAREKLIEDMIQSFGESPDPRQRLAASEMREGITIRKARLAEAGTVVERELTLAEEHVRAAQQLNLDAALGEKLVASAEVTDKVKSWGASPDSYKKQVLQKFENGTQGPVSNGGRQDSGSPGRNSGTAEGPLGGLGEAVDKVVDAFDRSTDLKNFGEAARYASDSVSNNRWRHYDRATAAMDRARSEVRSILQEGRIEAQDHWNNGIALLTEARKVEMMNTFKDMQTNQLKTMLILGAFGNLQQLAGQGATMAGGIASQAAAIGARN